jgi:urea carboxylase-associated protein 1
VVRAGQRLRITDLEGTQAVDTLFYDAADPSERYSAADTIRAQGNIFLTTGSVLLSGDGRRMLTVVADTCGRHDTVGGACSAESNTCRFGHHTRAMHNCRDNFLVGLARHGLGKRDLVPNINFFMHVPVTAEGRLDIVDGISHAGDHIELVAEMDVLAVISNCPQLNNPCNGWNPTPIGLTIRDAA